MVTSLAGSPGSGRSGPGLCCASARLGTFGGVLLGALAGIVLTIVTVAADGRSYAAYSEVLGLWLIAAAILIGGAAGLLVGLVNGTVLGALAATVLRNRAHDLSKTRVSAAAFLISGLTSFAVLSVLFRGSPGLILPLTGAAALLAVPLSRRLPLDRGPG